MSRTFQAKAAVREAIPLFIGIVAPSGAGKTFSALRLATGIQKVVGGEVFLIDTENKRALAYSSLFTFKHVVFDPPFGSLDYLAALEYCAAQGAKTIIVDSTSHEHDALLEAHETELDRMAGNDYKKRERMALLGWAKPKAARRKLLQELTRLNVNVILLFRAKTTSKPIKNKEGKTEIVPMGFMPIAGDEFVYEMSLSCLLLPGADGVPTWQAEHPGERMAIKLPAQFRNIIKPGEPLSEELGVKLAEWARGGAAKPAASGTVSSAASPAPAGPMHTPETLEFALVDCETVDDLKATWKALESRLPKEPPDALLACQTVYKARLAQIKAATAAPTTGV